jgi:hypothetical protein
MQYGIDCAMPQRECTNELHHFESRVAGVGNALTDGVLKDDAAVTDGVIHGRVVAVNHEGGATKNVGRRIRIEMGDDRTFVAWIIEEGLDGAGASRQGADILIVFKIGIIQAGSISGVAGTDELAVLAEVSIDANVAPHAVFLSMNRRSQGASAVRSVECECATTVCNRGAVCKRNNGWVNQ